MALFQNLLNSALTAPTNDPRILKEVYGMGGSAPSPLGRIGDVIGSALQGDRDDLERRHMENVYSADPRFASQLYSGLQNQDQLIQQRNRLASIQRAEEIARIKEEQQQSALREFAQGAENLSPADSLSRYAEITGDVSPLLKWQAEAEGRDLDRQYKMAQIGALNAKSQSGGFKGFEGNGIENQALNIVTENNLKKKAGIPLSPQDQIIDNLARQRLGREESFVDESGQVITRKAYDLSQLDSVGTQDPSQPIQPPSPPKRTFNQAQRFEKEESLRDIEKGLDTIGLLEKRFEDPTSAGILGSVRKGLETTTGVIGDVSQSFPIVGLEQLGEGIKSVGTLGNPNQTVTELNPLVNDLAYALAQARKGGGKLNKDDIDSARKDVDIFGIQSTDQVKKKLDTIKKDLERTRGALRGDLGVPQPPQFDQSLFEYMTPEERALFQ